MMISSYWEGLEEVLGFRYSKMLNISNETKFKIKDDDLEAIAMATMKKCERTGDEFEVDLFLISPEAIALINKKYRKKDKPTDVLSFSYLDEKKFKAPEDKKNLLGEIFIAPSVIEHQAEEFGITFDQEMRKVLVHGILHLLGHDHEGGENEALKMEGFEKEILLGISI